MQKFEWSLGFLIALLFTPTKSSGRESTPSRLCALLSPTTVAADLPCGNTSSDFATSTGLPSEHGDACGRALLEALLLMPTSVAFSAELPWSCLNTEALLIAVERYPELDSALWRGALSDATLALQEQSATVDNTSMRSLGCAQCSFVHQVLASQANHHSEKGPYLARALDAAEAHDDVVLSLKARDGPRLWEFSNSESGAEAGTGVPLTESCHEAATAWADKWAGTEWSASGAAAKNYAFFLEHRDLPLEGDAVLDRAVARINITSHDEDPSTSSGQSEAVFSPQMSGLALQRAMLCPPHFASLAAAAGIHQSIVSKLDNFLANAIVSRHYQHHHHRSANSGSNAEDEFWRQDVGFPASPLRLLGALPLAWPYLGYSMRPLHERLCLSLRLLAGPSLTVVAPHLNPLLPPLPDSPSPLTTSLPEEKEERIMQPQQERTSREPKRRRVKLGVFGESQGNTSPGVLAGGWLARLPRKDIELVWFEPEHLNTVFAGMMRARADTTVVLSEQPTRLRGSVTSDHANGGGGKYSYDSKDAVHSSRDMTPLFAADPLVVARVAVAVQRCDVLLYLALGITPMTFLLAQARLAPVQVAFEHGHPITSGAHESIDYFVSSALFQTSSFSASHAADKTDVNTTMEEGYTEQLVLFDTLTAALPPFHTRSPQHRAEPRSSAPTSTAAGAAAAGEAVGEAVGDEKTKTSDEAWLALEETSVPPSTPRLSRRVLLEQLGLPDLFSRQPGPLSGVAASSPVPARSTDSRTHSNDNPESAHVFACLQHSKKLHPAFDAALAHLLAIDPNAIVLLLDGNRVHLRRWATTLLVDAQAGATEMTTASRQTPLARLRFLPRMPHASLLALLSVSDAFLDPWPWGAGVTSAEAFSLCLPVVTWPQAQSVAPLTLGQYRQMGLAGDYDTPRHGARASYGGSRSGGLGLVAHNATHYAHLSARLGLDPLFRAHASERICARKGRLTGQWAVVDEWAAFLRTAARPYMGTGG